ncbi:MAG: hypothetical protein J7M21_02570 [Planctomycetes bacterium]|nr:hypothetical protein [Planctomycetota bacterium]
MKRTTLTFALSAPFVLVVASVCSAEMMTYDGTDSVCAVKFHADGVWADGKMVLAGFLNVTYQQQPYRALCVDADHRAGTSNVTELPVEALHNGRRIAWLWETYSDTVDTAQLASALQVAVWEMLYENDGQEGDVRGGRFHITCNETVAAIANGMLQPLPDSYVPSAELVVLHSPHRQDMLIERLGNIPEPMTLALVALAGPLVVCRRRRMRALEG